MSKNLEANRRGRRHREDYEPILAVMFRESPLSPEEVKKRTSLFSSYFEAFGYHFAEEIKKESSGFLARLGLRLPEKTERSRRIRSRDSGRFDFGGACQRLLDRGLIEVNSRGDYGLTDLGRSEAEGSAQSLENAIRTLERAFLSPTAAARNTIIATSFLTLIKLAAGFLSGSLGLIADGVDSFVDSLSAIVVWLGVRSRKELLASSVTVLMMFVAAVSVGYESADRLLAILTSTVSPMSMPLVVILVEGVALSFSFVLSVYQRIVGRTRASLALVSQSVDSKNHVYVAASVILGAIFSMVGVQFVDALVGAFVAARIFIDASRLSKDTLSQARGQGVDMSKYQVPLERPYKAGREETLTTWILYVIGEDMSATKEEIIESIEEVYSIGKGIPFVSEFGLSPRMVSDFEQRFDVLIKELLEEGFVRKEGKRFLLNPTGKSRVDRVFRNLRYRKQTQPTVQVEVARQV